MSTLDVHVYVPSAWYWSVCGVSVCAVRLQTRRAHVHACTRAAASRVACTEAEALVSDRGGRSVAAIIISVGIVAIFSDSRTLRGDGQRKLCHISPLQLFIQRRCKPQYKLSR